MNILDVLRIKRDSSEPITNQICEQISWLISTGELKPGEHLPPIRPAADALGVHMHTVRGSYHLLEQRGLVSTTPGKGTVVLDYAPFALKAFESNRGSHLIGILFPDLTPFYTQFLNGAEQAAREEHFLISIMKIGDTPNLAEKYLELLIAKNIDGMIIASQGFSPQFQKKLDDGETVLPFPIVYADVPNIFYSAVQLDSASAAFQAAIHLLDHGHSSIGLINAPQESPHGNEIYKGFQEGLRARGAGASQLFIRTVNELSIEAGYQAGLMLVSSGLKPTAIFAINDALAVGAMRAFNDRGLRVPEDVAVIGYNDLEIASLVEPSLTSVSAPAYELGMRSVRMLLQVISSGQKKCENIILPTKLVIRRSCGCSLAN
jgi:LacI family repressor for deo operon, udp, cdd, tsx, nupC, and nupG